MATQLNKCEDCKFYDAYHCEDNELATGWCRRYPPVFMGEGLYDFPGVADDDWCGEYVSERAANDDKSVDVLSLGEQVRSGLRRNLITTVGQLRATSDHDLLGIRHFGRGRLQEIRQALATYGDGNGKEAV